MSRRISAVLLAAGLSKRMGQPKQLLCLNGKPMIRHCIDALISAGLDDIVVVLRQSNQEVIKAVNGFPVHVVFNTVPDSDMAESLRTGLQAVDSSSTGIIISLADHPLVSADTIKRIAECHENEPGRIFIPQYEGKKGHPVLLPKILLEDIFNGGILSDIIKSHSEKVSLITVKDEGVIIDIDTMDDYRKVLQSSLTRSLC